MYYFKKRGALGDLPSACDPGPNYNAEVCAELSPPQNAISSVLSWVGNLVGGGGTSTADAGAASSAGVAAQVGTKPGGTAASVAGLPIIPIALGLGAVWFLFMRKGK